MRNAPIVAKVIFKDGNRRFFDGSRYEKEELGAMVYKLRNMLINFHRAGKIKEVQMYDNTRTDDRLILEYKDGIMLRNDLASYLGKDYNAKQLHDNETKQQF